MREKLFAGQPSIGETVRISGVRFTVVGTMDIKLQDSNYFTSDDECASMPFSPPAMYRDTRYASVSSMRPLRRDE